MTPGTHGQCRIDDSTDTSAQIKELMVKAKDVSGTAGTWLTYLLTEVSKAPNSSAAKQVVWHLGQKMPELYFYARHSKCRHFLSGLFKATEKSVKWAGKAAPFMSAIDGVLAFGKIFIKFEEAYELTCKANNAFFSAGENARLALGEAANEVATQRRLGRTRAEIDMRALQKHWSEMMKKGSYTYDDIYRSLGVPTRKDGRAPKIHGYLQQVERQVKRGRVEVDGRLNAVLRDVHGEIVGLIPTAAGFIPTVYTQLFSIGCTVLGQLGLWGKIYDLQTRVDNDYFRESEREVAARCVAGVFYNPVYYYQLRAEGYKHAADIVKAMGG